MTPQEQALIFGMAAATILTRYPFLLFFSRRKMPERVLAALKYVPPAVLSAIILPNILFSNGALNLELSNAPLFASIIAAIIARRTRNLLLTILIGMAAFWIWRFLLFP